MYQGVIMKKALLSLCIVTLVFFSSVTASAQANPDVDIVLGFLIDGSGSISAVDFDIIREALAMTLMDTALVPHDGTVEVVVTQFFNQGADTFVEPMALTPDNIEEIVRRIRRMPQGGGGTPLWGGINQIVNQMRSSPNYDTAIRRVINIATDGQPQVPVRDITVRQGINLSMEARERAIDFGIDEIDSEGIGAATSDRNFQNFLLDLVYPQPGTLITNGDLGNGGMDVDPGFVILVNDFGDFETAVRDKVLAVLSNAGVGGNGNGTPTPTPRPSPTPDPGNGGVGNGGTGSDGRPIPFETPIGMVLLTGMMGAMLIVLRFRTNFGFEMRK
jgi:hypothetical protein